MKITKSSKKLASNYGEGTVFYAVTLHDAVEAFEEVDNLFLAAELESNKWDHLNLRNNLFGSGIIDDILYICVTDGHAVDIEETDAEVDPEDLIDTYGEDFVNYAPVNDASPETIRKYISAYEFSNLDINTLGGQLIDMNNFLDVVDAYLEYIQPAYK